MKIHTFENLVVDKEGVEGTARITSGLANVEFSLRRIDPNRKRSFIVSKGRPGDKMIKEQRSAPPESDRQDLTKRFIEALISEHPEAIAPVLFKDQSGKSWKIDRDCAAWAKGQYQTVIDSHGVEAFRRKA